MFKIRVNQVVDLIRISDKANQYLGGMALAFLATVAAVGLFAITGSNRGVASILTIVVMLSSAALGWRAGLTAAVVATLVQDFFFMGDRPYVLFLDSAPQYFLIYLCFLAGALIPARDLPAVLPAPDELPLSGSDFVAESIKGEADAEKLLADAIRSNETWRVTAALQNITKAGVWTGYEAGFVHAIARSALGQAETTAFLTPANDDPDRIDADAGIVAADGNVVRLPMRGEQVPLYVNSKD